MELYFSKNTYFNTSWELKKRRMNEFLNRIKGYVDLMHVAVKFFFCVFSCFCYQLLPVFSKKIFFDRSFIGKIFYHRTEPVAWRRFKYVLSNMYCAKFVKICLCWTLSFRKITGYEHVTFLKRDSGIGPFL